MTYKWDDQNRLVAVAKEGEAPFVTYEYDDDNVRVSQTVGDETTEFVMDKNRAYAQVLAEYVRSQLIEEYVYGLDLIEQTDGTTRDEAFFGVDGLGSTVVLTDENGEVIETYEYDEFGELEDVAGELATDYLFAGEQFDGLLGDYYLRQRYYDPSIGRFTRRDTYEGRLNEPITLNKFVYGNSNPVTYTDPSRLASLVQQVATQQLLVDLIVLGIAANDFIRGGEPLEPLGGFGEGGRSIDASTPPLRPGRSLLQRVLSFPGRNAGPKIEHTLPFPTNTYEDFVQHIFSSGTTVQDILMPGNKPIGTPGTSNKIRELTGTWEDAYDLAQRVGDAAGGYTDITPPAYEAKEGIMVRLIQLNSGGTIGIREIMSDSPGTNATVDVNIPGIPIKKIKYNP